jgi:hypothetical protein
MYHSDADLAEHRTGRLEAGETVPVVPHEPRRFRVQSFGNHPIENWRVSQLMLDLEREWMGTVVDGFSRGA